MTLDTSQCGASLLRQALLLVLGHRAGFRLNAAGWRIVHGLFLLGVCLLRLPLTWQPVA